MILNLLCGFVYSNSLCHIFFTVYRPDDPRAAKVKNDNKGL